MLRMPINYISLILILATIFWSVEGQNQTGALQRDIKPTSLNDLDQRRVKKVGKSDSNDDNDDDYNDYVDESENAKQARQRNVSVVKRIGITYSWGRWEKWSKCSNSCVQIRQRKCFKRVQNDQSSDAIETSFYPTNNSSPGCFGILKRYRLCKDEKCRTYGHQLRDEQCANYNKILYRGKFHDWIGYEKEHNECALYCRPRNSDIFVSMNESVTDGTPCEKPSIYYTHAFRKKAVCVEGICRAVHSSGAIRPSTTNDSQRRCGSVLCQAISEIYSKPKMPYGYNTITTIPAGAMNMTIKEMEKSDNLLALKTMDDIFLINGNGRPSDGGIFEYNGDVYDYNKEQGTITAKGPIGRPVILLLFTRSINTGIKYDYTVPVSSAAISEEEEYQSQWNEHGQVLDEVDENNIESTRLKERKRRKFSWKLLGFGQCNRSCGPGVQTPIFRCIRESPTRYYSPKRCAFAEKPVFSEDIYQCNRGLCPAYWRPGNYSDCKCSEGSNDGTRLRFMKCVQEQITGDVEEVDETKCSQDKLPEFEETCKCQNRRKIYHRDPEKTPRIYSRLLSSPVVITRPIINSTSALRRNSRDDRRDKSGVWLMSPWSEECTFLSCGAGFEQRSIYCDRTAPNTDLCDLRNTPEQRRSCSKVDESDCYKGTWFFSEWDSCSGDCFNLERKRSVFCLRDGYVVSDADCLHIPKPAEVTNCTQKDVKYCGPKWHYSEWSECSRSCGEGTQRRSARCLEYDWKQKSLTESNQCKYLDRDPVYRACNIQKCEEEKKVLEPELNDITPPEEGCVDAFTNCKRINRQRLCKLQYYKTYCCLTCNGFY